ncbi:MAG: type II secretion system F family protein [Thermoleophilia bacterium]
MNAPPPALLAGAGTALVVAALMRRDPPHARRSSPAPRVPGAAILARRLRRAGLAVPAAVAAGAVAAATLAVALLALTMGSVTLAVIAVPGVPAAVHLALAARERRYPDRVAAQLPGVLRATADGIAAGRSLRRALARAADAAPEPARGEFLLVVDHLELGGRIDGALTGLVERCPSPETELLRGAVLVNAGSGGDLAAVLGGLGRRLEERRRLTRELRGLGEQARMTAWLVGGLPALGGLAVELTAPGVLGGALLRGPGRISLAAAALLMGAAVMLIRRIGRA